MSNFTLETRRENHLTEFLSFYEKQINSGVFIALPVRIRVLTGVRRATVLGPGRNPGTV
jgi:hypothetical protein